MQKQKQNKISYRDQQKCRKLKEFDKDKEEDEVEDNGVVDKARND
jgi:hypothetical protein